VGSEVSEIHVGKEVWILILLFHEECHCLDTEVPVKGEVEIGIVVSAANVV
jgi:hypothetical protein